jgi:DnaK suppressor protein
MSSSGSNQSNQAELLLARRKALLSDIRTRLHRDENSTLALLNHLQEVSDWAEADLLNDTEIALLGTELSELRDIDSALLRIKAGTYGTCVDCGDPIPPERLQAQMIAQRCIACQMKADKRHGLERNNTL